MSKIQRSNNHFSLIFVSDWCRCDASASSVAFIFLDYIHIKIEGLTEIYAVQFIKCFIVRRTLVCISGAFVALLFGVSFLSPFFGFEKWAAFCITCLLYTFYTLYLKSHTIQIGLEYMSFSMYQDYYASNLAHNTWFKYEEKQISYLIRMNPHTHTHLEWNCWCGNLLGCEREPVNKHSRSKRLARGLCHSQSHSVILRLAPIHWQTI